MAEPREFLTKNSAVSPQQVYEELTLAAVLNSGNDAEGLTISGLGDPGDPQDAATQAYVDASHTGLAGVLAVSREVGEVLSGGLAFVATPAVDVDAFVNATATAAGTGAAFAGRTAVSANGIAESTGRAETSGSGDAFASIHATATGTGDTDACTYARSVDGNALADNDAAATGTGQVDAGCYAAGVDGVIIVAGATATATGSGNATVADLATANTGSATAGSLAVRGAASAGMQAVVDGTSARMAFNGVTPIAKPNITGSRGGNAALASLLTELAALGLITDGTS